ncbi:hypothetical protein G9C85_03475 [Halorubellus sp. JP-L1]|uniref:hypothetical protein n=1 Tax=Halorubellus sp. JP-L1 TaxID=2715753 RepID=UPI00140C05CC|nr:hypothetical protein [Halorubellus sp. JP-L1]NHN40696.1 hypothetical protein [Halorubellus sp. JP-L1]
MMWQDLVFMAGSAFGIIVLLPTLKDQMASVPLGTAAPSAAIGLVYGSAFFTMDMVLSAVGAFATGVIWSLIALFRSPRSPVSETA